MTEYTNVQESAGLNQRRCPRCGISADKRDFDLLRFARLLDNALHQVEILTEHAVYPSAQETLEAVRGVVAMCRPALHSTSCRGKDFEHHERPEHDVSNPPRWRCPDCGDTGGLKPPLANLFALQPLLWRLQEQMLDQDAVFLVPSDATPGELGQCFGRPVFRVRGIDRPLIALSAEVLEALAGPKIESKS